MLSFLCVILLGSLLLSLPVSSADGNGVPYLDALFTATTATCVTGLVTVSTASTWSTVGHVIILILIQIGGLGVITIISAVMILFHKRMGINNRLLLQDAFNLNSLSGIVRFVKRVILGTFLVEGIGAALYCRFLFLNLVRKESGFLFSHPSRPSAMRVWISSGRTACALMQPIPL